LILLARRNQFLQEWGDVVEVTLDHLKAAMDEFDVNLRHKKDWDGWTENKSYKFAILDAGKIYPVKHILSIATGQPKSDFSGGLQANTAITKCGLSIISLRESSWTIKSADDAVKILDKSAFTQGTGIPIEIRPFFMAQDPQPGEQQQVELVLDGVKYSAYIAIESSPTHRTRLFWQKEFVNALAASFPSHFSYVQNGTDIGELPSAEMQFTRLNGYKLYLVTVRLGGPPSAEWTDEEMEAAVKAYLDMREQEAAGMPYSKAAINRELREGPLAKRSKASVEYRMQNISAVLEDINQPTIKGYPPAKNIGSQAKERILSILEVLRQYSPEDYKPDFDDKAVDTKVGRLLRKGISGVPKGQAKPQQSVKSTTTYARDPSVKAWILQNARGKCEACQGDAPFTNDIGPYLEVHHMVNLAHGGPDIVTNTVALCPNCHRRCHVSTDKDSFIKTIYCKIERLKK
jgi:5-methylcytosine-specific restriction protein A